jgi:uncharacterized protein (TIGR04551 family)
MRIVPWLLGKSCGASRKPGRTGAALSFLPLLCAAVGISSAASPSTAYAQPKPATEAPKPAKPKPKPKPAAKPPAQPAAKPPEGAADNGAPGAGDSALETGTAAAAPQTGTVSGTPDAAQPGDPNTATQPPKKNDEPLVPPTTAAQTTTTAATPDPDKDAKALKEQGDERPTGAGQVGQSRSEVFAEDWWSHARPTFEIHGYYRLRAELFHKFALGRVDAPGVQIWPQPPDNNHRDAFGGAHPVALCGSDPLKPEACENHTQAGANMRFRINPELHISDNLRVLSQVDLLDNLVLGSTPEGYVNQPGDGGYRVVGRGGYAPTGAFASTQWAPTAGQNSLQDSVSVKRVWGEYLTPLGVLRFGRMPSHWGLGMFANGGDGYDSDWQSTADRIMFVTGFKAFDLYLAGAWDFANEGPISASLNERQGQPYDLGQLDDVSQYVFVAARRRDPELQKLDLARGDIVMNGGLYFVFRNQVLANDTTTTGQAGAFGESPYNINKGYVRRGAEAYIPDLWFQLLYKKFRFEVEAAMVYGSIENTISVGGSGTDYNNEADDENDGWRIWQFGLAAEMDYRAVEDRMRLGMGFGYSTGDDDVDSIAPQGQGLQPQRTADRTFSTFRFHPDYRVDLILFRNILSRVQGAYYFRPSIDYDFTRDKNGQKLGGGAAMIWSRASEFVQAPGHSRDLGVELNFQVYYQSKDGALNDDPNKMGGFYTSLQYGVLFPLGGLGYLPGEVEDGKTVGLELDTSTAQTLRWYLGVMF